jgi:protein-tyrosine phosphatase
MAHEADNEIDIANKFIDLEWQQRHRIAAGMQHGASNGDNPSPWSRVDPMQDADVLRRNRYLNVEPFASNRVRLRVPDGVSDYINASPIVLKQSVSGTEKRYIATQGPKGETAAHLWRMALTETGTASDPAVVVMLTQTHESGKEKCAAYYPLDMQHGVIPLNEQDEFGDGFRATLTLKSMKDDSETRSTIREIELDASAPAGIAIGTDEAKSGPEATVDDPATPGPSGPTIKKPIHHLLFTGWPDFSIPEGADRAALVKLISLSSRLNNNSPSIPRIVHCSAGVGRSGTFIALDYLLQEIAEGAWDDWAALEASTPQHDNGAGAEAATSSEEGNARDSMILTDAGRARDPVLEVVDSLRKQRMMMVQGEGQFAFLYDVCRDVWLERTQGPKSDSQ